MSKLKDAALGTRVFLPSETLGTPDRNYRVVGLHTITAPAPHPHADRVSSLKIFLISQEPLEDRADLKPKPGI